MGQEAQALIVEFLAGESRGKHLAGRVKLHLMEEVVIVAGMMNPVTRVTTTVTPGATTSKMTGNHLFLFTRWLYSIKNIFSVQFAIITTSNGFGLGPIHGLTHPKCSRAGVPIVEMEVKPGVVLLMVPEQEPATTGGNLKKVQARWVGTATVTGPALDVGASQVEPTQVAVTPG